MLVPSSGHRRQPVDLPELSYDTLKNYSRQARSSRCPTCWW
ncbi:MAG: hypothetical protein U1F49_11105 [Rubrivivax sp.]